MLSPIKHSAGVVRFDPLTSIRAGFPLLSSDPLLSFRRKSQGICLPKISSGEEGLPIFWPEGPEIGAAGAVAENFGQTFEKSGLKMQ